MPVLKYEQIADDLRARIADGEFGPGVMLPSGRKCLQGVDLLAQVRYWPQQAL